MGFADYRIEDAVQENGIVSLPDVPTLSAKDLKAKFDYLSVTIIQALNGLIDYLQDPNCAGDFTLYDLNGEAVTVQGYVASLAEFLQDLQAVGGAAKIGTGKSGITVQDVINEFYDLAQADAAAGLGAKDSSGAATTVQACLNALWTAISGGGSIALTVVDALDSTRTDAALSANQGRVLLGKIPEIVDALTSKSTTAALSAAQGKKLADEKLDKAAVLDLFYPVGTVYQTADADFNPQTAWGGTWVQIKDMFLLGAGDTYAGGTTGGEATHVLTASEGPKHTHASYILNSSGGSLVKPDTGKMAINTGAVTGTSDSGYTTAWASLTMQAAGGGAAHNNMPPYVAVYIWKRTA